VNFLRFLIERLEAREFLSFQNYISRKFIGFIAQNTLGINANYTQRAPALRGFRESLLSKKI
ncbi:hypothetical protein ACSN7Q_002350, partial [Flavobacterium psychrophilum]